VYREGSTAGSENLWKTAATVRASEEGLIENTHGRVLVYLQRLPYTDLNLVLFVHWMATINHTVSKRLALEWRVLCKAWPKVIA